MYETSANNQKLNIILNADISHFGKLGKATIKLNVLLEKAADGQSFNFKIP